MGIGRAGGNPQPPALPTDLRQTDNQMVYFEPGREPDDLTAHNRLNWSMMSRPCLEGQNGRREDVMRTVLAPPLSP